MVCQKAFKLPQQQKMAVLPVERVSLQGPFHHSAVDMMGPFNVKMYGRALHKVYVAVFTCMSMRSVHAEVVFKMDADSFINALVRFSARRPGVTSLISDRGTNFVATRSILRSELRRLNEEAAPELRKRGVEWPLIPAHTPHYGGVWERVVGLFKKHMATSMGGDPLHLDTFNTMIVEIEGILNRRPLTTLSDDSRDLEP